MNCESVFSRSDLFWLDEFILDWINFLLCIGKNRMRVFWRLKHFHWSRERTWFFPESVQSMISEARILHIFSFNYDLILLRSIKGPIIYCYPLSMYMYCQTLCTCVVSTCTFCVLCEKLEHCRKTEMGGCITNLWFFLNTIENNSSLFLLKNWNKTITSISPLIYCCKNLSWCIACTECICTWPFSDLSKTCFILMIQAKQLHIGKTYLFRISIPEKTIQGNKKFHIKILDQDHKSRLN